MHKGEADLKVRLYDTSAPRQFRAYVEAGLQTRLEGKTTMAIIRFDPFGEFAAARGPWIPAVDIFETDAHDVIIKAELPDMTRENIEVTVENQTLTLKGERKMPADVKEEQFRRVERAYGAFTRSFSLPNTVDASKVSADYKNGVLTVKLPFREEAKPRTISIEVAA
jgi:HSP20 family protein